MSEISRTKAGNKYFTETDGDGITNSGGEIGLPQNMRVKRRYTLSEKALEQRREAAQQPKPGMQGKRNNWRHGQYAKNFLTRIKPCLSSCGKYPCKLVSDGVTEPGGDCLDAAELLDIVHAVHAALMNPENQEQFTEISAVILGNNIRILQMLQEEILRDDTVMIRTTRMTKYGIEEDYKIHPAITALPKMIHDLGFTLDQFVMTPKAQKQLNTEEQAAKGITEMFKTVGGQLRQARDLKNGKG